MQVRNINKIPKESANGPLFTGDVTRRPLAPDSTDFNSSVVGFELGIRNKFHHHDSDQLLIVTEGTGKVVTASGEEAIVTPGDVIFAPAGESHWHGALDDTTFAHITVTRRGAETTQEEA